MCADKRHSSLKECVEFIEKHKMGYSKEDKPYSSDPEEETFEIQEDKIFEIPKCDDLHVKNIGFVDGGNGPILRSADFNISLNRVAGVLFSSNQWIEPIVQQF